MKIVGKKVTATGSGRYSKQIVLPKSWTEVNEIHNRISYIVCAKSPRLLVLLPETLTKTELLGQLRGLIEDLESEL